HSLRAAAPIRADDAVATGRPRNDGRAAWPGTPTATRPALGFSGMTLAVEEDVAPDPCDVGRLRTSAVMAKPGGGPHAIEQARLGGLRGSPLTKRTRVVAPAAAGDRRVGRRAVHRSAIPFVPHLGNHRRLCKACPLRGGFDTLAGPER